MAVASKKMSKKKKEQKEENKSNFGIVIKTIIIIAIFTSIPILFYNPDLSFGPLDVLRRDFYKTEILMSGKSYSTTGLTRAIRNDDLRTVKLFVRSGFNINDNDDSGRSPLCIAAASGNLAMVNVLLQGDANLVVRNFSDGLTPIYCAIKGDNVQVLDKFVRSGMGVNFRTDLYDGISLLHYAAASGLDNIVSYLIQSGADVNIQDSNGQTPLHKAVTQDNIVVLYSLLNAGANVDLEDNQGDSPIDTAKDNDKEVYVSLLERYTKK
ncbi:MAG: ankyrin repeat domain-containing protein [Candidatus Gastranaerophilales bacterium]|nr:ankyrin repeat domain-containing protein [Candidatus Gastranaerophilales bacterium]